VSSVAVIDALRGKGHDVAAVGIDRTGGWHLADPGLSPLVAEGPEVVLEVPSGRLMAPGGPVAFDVVFPVLHGPWGEDGTIQGLFEIAGIPYVGSGVMSSAIAMDKDVAKRLCREAGIPVGDFRIVRGRQFRDDPAAVVDDIGGVLGFPLFVKPASLGSSVGITRAADEGMLKESIVEALDYGGKVIVEAELPGREIEVAVLEGPRASVPGEIVVDGWYTYDAKYQDEATRLIVPAPLDDDATAEVRAMASRAFEVLECQGLARVDFFYDESGDGFVLNEVNTMPGFTPMSMFPQMWAATGMSYPDLCDELVALALSR